MAKFLIPQATSWSSFCDANGCLCFDFAIAFAFAFAIVIAFAIAYHLHISRHLYQPFNQSPMMTFHLQVHPWGVGQDPKYAGLD